MIAKLKFLFFYFLSWVVFFDLMRLLFMLYHIDKTKQLSFSTILAAFGHGLRMDIAVAAYILAPVILFVLLSLFIPFFQRLPVYKIYTFIALLFVALVCLFDLEMYTAWGFRIDSTPLRFLETPWEAWASISHFPLLLIFLLFAICYGLFYFCFKYMLRHVFFQQQHKRKLVTGITLVLLMGSLVIPIRGGLQLAPLNQSSVYFSTNNYANHTAINAPWNFLHSLFSKGANGKNPYQYMAASQAKSIVDSLYCNGPTTEQLVNFSTGSPVNVIVVIWESFTEKATHISRNGTEVTPGFNRLKEQGIYFSQAYASGDRTNKGLPAILSGYPAMPNTTIIHTPGKSAKLKVLSKLFKDKGYATPFYYGGEPEFANIKSYLLHAGFDPIVERADFSVGEMNSKWGAHDGIVMNRILEDLHQVKQPFFASWLTLSSHEPFETPVPVAISGNDNTSLFLNSLHYTDQVIADFVSRCQKEDWWKNTILVITGDHGHPLPETGHKADDFRIPMLWMGGALLKKGIVIDKVVSQLDLAAMLAAQTGFAPGEFPFSKNILDPAVQPWAFFSFNNGFGFVDSTGRLVFDNVGKFPIEQEGDAGAKKIEAGKAMQQVSFQDFLEK